MAKITRQGRPPVQITVRSIGTPPPAMLEMFARMIFEHVNNNTPNLRLVPTGEKTSKLNG